MLLKIHTAYFNEFEIGCIETVAGPGLESGFRVTLKFGQAERFVPCPEALLAAVRAEIDAQLAAFLELSRRQVEWANQNRLADPKPKSVGCDIDALLPDPGPIREEPKPPRGGFF